MEAILIVLREGTFGSGCLAAFEMEGNKCLRLLTLPLQDLLYVDGHRTGHHAEFSSAKPVWARSRSHFWARTADPPALHHGDLFASLLQMPGEIFATFAATNDDCEYDSASVIALYPHRRIVSGRAGAG